jgi:hypothetical protein
MKVSHEQARELLALKQALLSCATLHIKTDQKHLVRACSEAVAALQGFQWLPPVAAFGSTSDIHCQALLDNEIGFAPLLLTVTQWAVAAMCGETKPGSRKAVVLEALCITCLDHLKVLPKHASHPSLMDTLCSQLCQDPSGQSACCPSSPSCCLTTAV